ncbi:hypothetical protein K474DRAFT_1277460 [Panus rudis PR-1116 ss-1]|nr:hypothetical protein K474DRAFT_1277460 [Panus rudis PR-1116 ss-1]
MVASLDKRADGDVPGTSSELSAWLFFNIAAGHVALPILAATLLIARPARRHPVVFNLCLTWIISGICSTLLFYVGEHIGPDPNNHLCAAQASLMEALQVLTSSALLSLAYYIWHSFTSEEEIFDKTRRRFLIGAGLLGVPYALFGIFVAVGVSLSLRHMDRVTRAQEYFYCSLNWMPFTEAVSVISTLICIGTFVFEALTIRYLVRLWRLIRSSGYIEELDIHMLARVCFITVYHTAFIILQLISMWRNLGVLPAMFRASVGLVVFLALASHPAVVKSWSLRPRISSDSMSPRLSLPWYRSPSLPINPSQTHTRSSISETDVSTTASGKDLKYIDSRMGHPMHSIPYLPKAGNGVKIIGRPEEAFASFHPMGNGAMGIHGGGSQRNTIRTWGFD